MRAAVERSWGAHSELLTTAAARIPGVSLQRTTAAISVAHFHGLADRPAPGSELLQGMSSLYKYIFYLGPTVPFLCDYTEVKNNFCLKSSKIVNITLENSTLVTLHLHAYQVYGFLSDTYMKMCILGYLIVLPGFIF